MEGRRIGGEWRGHYSYKHAPDHGDGFNAFISEKEDRIEGTIVDDSGPGPASITGSFSFPSLEFTKVYLRPGMVRHEEMIGDKKIVIGEHYGAPVQYEGTMSEDGKSMGGTWMIVDSSTSGLVNAGRWSAYRVEEEESAKEAEQKKAKGKGQTDKVRETEEHLI